jgi:hypothetical protein
MTQRIVTKTIGTNGVLEAGAVRDLPESLWRQISEQVGMPLSEFTKLPAELARETSALRSPTPAPTGKKRPLKKRSA